MKKRGAKPGDLVALLSATGAQTETIPPSHRADHHRLGHRRVDRRAVHRRPAAGAWCWALALCVVVWWRYRARRPERRASATPSARSASSLMVALPALLLPFVIRAAVVEGVATATEVSTIGIVYSVLVGLLVYRQFDWRRLKPMLVETASLSGAIIFIVGCATAMAWGLTQSGFSQDLAQADGRDARAARYGFLAVSIVAFIVLGSVLEGIPAIVLFGPLLFPIAKAGRRARGALRDGGDLRDGHRPVRAAVRRRLLRRLRDQQGRSRRGHAAHLGLHRWRCWSGLVLVAAIPVVLHRLPQDLTTTLVHGAYLMSRFFGEIRQLGYVVPDIEAAMDYWSRALGVGPWFYNPQVPIVNYRYRGEALRAAQLGGARQLRAACRSS